MQDDLKQCIARLYLLISSLHKRSSGYLSANFNVSVDEGLWRVAFEGKTAKGETQIDGLGWTFVEAFEAFGERYCDLQHQQDGTKVVPLLKLVNQSEAPDQPPTDGEAASQ